MREDLYYDFQNRKTLCSKDGCKLEDWSKKSNQAHFALHPKGFPVFIDPEKIEKSDEYAKGDPYQVKKGLKSKFHKRRVDCTIGLLKLILPQKHDGYKILDLGCGEGHITKEILTSFPKTELCGLDYSLGAIEFATNNFPGIEFCVADAHQPPYRSDYFDVVVCNNIWEHVPDPVMLLYSIRRILKSQGHLIISTPSRYRIVNLIRVLFGKSPSLMADNHVTEYTIGQITEQLRFVNFTVEKTYSKTKKEIPKSIKEFIAYKIAKPILGLYIKLIKSHHCLESTVFFLSKKSKSTF